MDYRKKTDRELKATLDALQRGNGTLPRVPNGKTRSRSDAELRQVVPDGDPGPKTRQKLYADYMDAICVNAKDEPFHFDPGEFLGKGADPKGKADYQGCSEFNPILLFSKEEDDIFQRKTDRSWEVLDDGSCFENNKEFAAPTPEGGYIKF